MSEKFRWGDFIYSHCSPLTDLFSRCRGTIWSSPQWKVCFFSLKWRSIISEVDVKCTTL